MRRIFWPGACSAAIKDLQHALSQKASNNSPTKHSEMPSTRQQDTHNTSITGNRRISESTSMQDQLNGTPVINQPLSINNNISAPTSSMLDNPTTDSVPALPSFQDDAAFLQDWPAMNGQFLPMENSFTDFDDIFQFMDVPYHLNDLT